jgi:cell division protein FtsB
MTAQAACLHGRVHKFVLGLVIVALQALFRISIFIQRNRVHRRAGTRRQREKQTYTNESTDARLAKAGILYAEP